MLVFQLWPQFEPIQLHTDTGAPLQIELVKRTKEQPAAPTIQAARPTPPVKIETRQKPNRAEVKIAKKQEAPQKNMDKVAPPSRESPQEREVVTYNAASETVSKPGVMPVIVEQMILTHISYPRQARRKGWQGKTTFHLDVREQKLAHLDVFHSSGYELLDKAATRGIRAIDHLPLANGLYRLPVEFRLQ